MVSTKSNGRVRDALENSNVGDNTLRRVQRVLIRPVEAGTSTGLTIELAQIEKYAPERAWPSRMGSTETHKSQTQAAKDEMMLLEQIVFNTASSA